MASSLLAQLQQLGARSSSSTTSSTSSASSPGIASASQLASLAPIAPLDAKGVLAIVVFACVSLVVIRPLRIPLPHALYEAGQRAFSYDYHTQPRSHSADERAGRRLSSRKRHYLTIDHVTAPLLAVLLLLATTTIGGAQLAAGIAGDPSSHIEPYDVLALFFSLAYIAISLDATGLLRYLAFRVALLRLSRRGIALYLLLYTFFFLLGVLVGNDPVILSGTAFLVYFTRAAGISPPSAWIWAQFGAANLSSAVLVSSNPTNLVIAKGFGVSFLHYTAYMALPSVASALAALAVMLLFFRNRPPLRELVLRSAGAGAGAGEAHGEKKGKEEEEEEDTVQVEGEAGQGKGQGGAAQETSSKATSSGALKRRKSSSHLAPSSSASSAPSPPSPAPKHRLAREPIIFIPRVIVPPDVSPRQALVDPYGALFNAFIMASTLIVLIATSVVGGVKVFMIALPGAALCLAHDVAWDLHGWRARREERRREARESAGEGRSGQELGLGQGPGPGQQEQAAPASTAGEGKEAIELSALPKRPEPAATSSNSASGSANGVETPLADGDGEPSKPASLRSHTSRTSLAPGGRASEHSQVESGASIPFAARALHALSLRLDAFSTTFPTVTFVLRRLPFPLLPFAFGMFILVQALAHVGFIDILASGLGRVCGQAGHAGSAFFICFLAIILCNLGGTNIGSTILLTKSLQSPYFQQHLPQAQRALLLKTTLYSVAFGSNVGALGGTFAASLAGLLWRAGLRQGGVTVTARQFALWCAVTIAPATIAGVAVIIAEVPHFTLGDEAFQEPAA